MFEIINMRGQQLSALDILKSRLLSRFSEKDRFGRTFLRTSGAAPMSVWFPRLKLPKATT